MTFCHLHYQSSFFVCLCFTTLLPPDFYCKRGLVKVLSILSSSFFTAEQTGKKTHYFFVFLSFTIPQLIMFATHQMLVFWVFGLIRDSRFKKCLPVHQFSFFSHNRGLLFQQFPTTRKSKLTFLSP